MSSHFIKPQDIAESHMDMQDLVGGEQSNFSKHFNLRKVGVHQFKIPTGLRTSLPHAEKTEEEFVYVIDGQVDLWLNGEITKMSTGDCIGFPAGTGDCHTFINNSGEDVELFVCGDRTKDDNQCYFAINPEIKAEVKGFWWEDAPRKELGSHNGLPGKVRDEQISKSQIIFNGHKHFTDESFSYPGDTETFGNGVCLSRHFGMKNIAIWLERLPIGKRSSWPHAHSVEEEFAYVLDGEVKVELNNKTHVLTSGVAIDFKAGSGVAHTIKNESKAFSYYICVGECEPKGDKIYYPMHPERNKEMKEKGELWENVPISS